MANDPIKKLEIERLSSLINKPFFGNPFWVLKLEWDATPETARAAYRHLSMLIHPDKNQGSDEAQDAFSVLNDAFTALNAASSRAVIDAFIDEAKHRVESRCTDPARYHAEVGETLAHLFVEHEQNQRKEEEKKREERQQARMEELALDEDAKEHQQIADEWEKKRVERVSHWKDFSSKKKSHRKKKVRHQ